MSDQDLSRYYKVLKQFLDISDDTSSSRSKSNSSRAQRAREKLLKLSSAQFKELSTDVYDELKRRIDESRSEPDFLLPKSTFHPKRNQARQKLSSLPQSRFKDLVSDISFEIERRNLHLSNSSIKTDANNAGNTHHQWSSQDQSANEKHELHESNGSEQAAHSSFQSHQHERGPSNASAKNTAPSHDLNNEVLQNDLSTPEIGAQDPKLAIGVQPTTVVPTKANLAWSSDEEGEDDIKQDLLGETIEKTNSSHTRDVELNHDNEEESITARRISLPSGFNQTKKVTDPEASASFSSQASPENLMDSVNRHEHQATQANSDLQAKLLALEKRNIDLEKGLSDLQGAHSKLLEKHESVTSTNRNLETSLAHLQDNRDQSVPQNVIEELDMLKAANAALRLENVALKNSQPKTPKTPLSESNMEQRGFDQSPSNNIAISTQPVDLRVELQKLLEKLDTRPSEPANKSKCEQLESEVIQWQKRYEEVQAGRITSAFQHPLQNSKDIKRYVSSTGVVPLSTASNFFALIESFVLLLNSDNFDNDMLFEKASRIALTANSIASQGKERMSSTSVHSEFVREAAGHALTATRYFASYRQLLPKIVVERAAAEVAFAVCDFIATSKLTDGNVTEPDSTPHVSPLKESKQANMMELPSVRPLKIANKLQSSYAMDNSKDSKSVLGAPVPNLEINAQKANDSVPKPVAVQISNPSEENSHIPKQHLEKSTDGNASNRQDHNDERERNMSMDEANLSGISTSTIETDARIPESKENYINGEVTKAPASSSSEGAVRKASLFERLQNSKLLQRETPESNGAGINSGVTHSVTQTDSQKSPSTPKKSIILEKVKQFESPENSSIKSSPTTPPSVSVFSATPNLSNGHSNSQEVSSEEKGTAESSIATGAPARGKSIFQSLREKFAHEKAKTEEKSMGDDSVNTTNNDDKSMNEEANSESMSLFHKDKSKAMKVNSAENSFQESAPDMKKDAAETEKQKAKVPETEKIDEVSAIISPSQMPGAFEPELTTVVTTEAPLTGSMEKRLESADETPEEDNEEARKEEDNEDEEAPRTPTKKSEVSPMKNHQTSVSGSPASKRSIQSPGAKSPGSGRGFPVKAPSFKVKRVNYAESPTKDNKSFKSESEYDDNDESEEESEDEEEEGARQRREYRKSMAAATFNFELFDIDDPDNTLTQVLLYLEHQTVQVITTIQDLLSAIKRPDSTRGDLRENSMAISEVIRQMTEATNTSMNQTRNHQLKEHGSWVVKSLEDCNHRMNTLCRSNTDRNDSDFADKNFKQRLAGISFDIAKCTKELVKTVEEASLKEDIAHLDARLNQEDLT
ncbi:hypothetical protein A9F13_11g01078 [Clavispora lusitaniae]|uniref:GIT Spa2 homology (SHD) domain-containing protein n=1 Tax=Clavispora lusitaniae TaxID=36911 RepID=A0AA91PZD7_CLALS|nr:hypothetical protein A9F13_11g01078 [Clavispora lusitaniae]